jgi:hypothetical protein
MNGKRLAAAIGAGALTWFLDQRTGLITRGGWRRLPLNRNLLASVAGTTLMGYGMRRRAAIGKAASMVGSRLFRKGVTGRAA